MKIDKKEVFKKLVLIFIVLIIVPVFSAIIGFQFGYLVGFAIDVFAGIILLTTLDKSKYLSKNLYVSLSVFSTLVFMYLIVQLFYISGMVKP